MRFEYEGFHKEGRAVKGEIEADTREIAIEKLRGEGLFLQTIEPVGQAKFVLHPEEKSELKPSPIGPPGPPPPTAPVPEAAKVAVDPAWEKELANDLASLIVVRDRIRSSFKYLVPTEQDCSDWVCKTDEACIPVLARCLSKAMDGLKKEKNA